MIVQAVGPTLERVTSRRDGPAPVRAGACEWIMITSDPGLRAELATVIERHGGVIRDPSAIDDWARLPPAGRRYAFVDLVATDDGSAERLLAQLAQTGAWPPPLLIVRGADGDAADELLARRTGAIAYLPGDVRAGFLDSLLAEIAA